MRTRQVGKGQPRRLSNETQRMREWLMHEDRLFSERASFMIVAEAMFFSAFAVLAGTPLPSSAMIIGVAGITVAVFWIYAAVTQEFVFMRPIKKILNQRLPEYSAVPREVRRIPLNIALGIVLPCLLIVAWAALIIIN